MATSAQPADSEGAGGDGGRWGCRVSGSYSGAVRSSGEKGGEEEARLAFVLVWELEREYAQQKK